MTEVNHLFIESIYNESGYFEYDSTQNFAHLNGDGTFTVYDQIAASGISSGPTRTPGQFMPYNDLVPGKYAVRDQPDRRAAATSCPIPTRARARSSI